MTTKPKAFRIVRDYNGAFLSRDYASHQWYWTKKENETHYFTSEDEASRLSAVLSYENTVEAK